MIIAINAAKTGSEITMLKTVLVVSWETCNLDQYLICEKKMACSIEERADFSDEKQSNDGNKSIKRIIANTDMSTVSYIHPRLQVKMPLQK